MSCKPERALHALLRTRPLPALALFPDSYLGRLPRIEFQRFKGYTEPFSGRAKIAKQANFQWRVISQHSVNLRDANSGFTRYVNRRSDRGLVGIVESTMKRKLKHTLKVDID